MSGGHFGYREDALIDIEDALDRIVRNGVPGYDCMGDHIGPQTLEEAFGEEAAQHFRDALVTIRRAYVYAHRIDFLLEADDGADTFCARLAEQLPKCAAKDWEAER